VFEELQHGTLDRSLFTANANSYFNAQVVSDFATGLKPLGAPKAFQEVRHRDRGGMTLRVYKVEFEKKSLNIWERDMPDGKIKQYQIFAAS